MEAGMLIGQRKEHSKYGVNQRGRIVELVTRG
jgi:hypothetical protein